MTEFAEELAHDDQSDGDDLIKPSQKHKADSASGDKSDPQAGNLTVKAPKKLQKEDFTEVAQAEEITRQKELDVAKAKVERATVKAKAKLAKIKLEKEKLVVERERRREKVEAKVMKMWFMGGSDQQHGTPSAHLNMHFASTEFLNTSLGPSSMHMPLPFALESSYYRAHLSLVSFQDENLASSSMSGAFPINSSHNPSDVFFPDVDNPETPFVNGRQLPGGQ